MEIMRVLETQILKFIIARPLLSYFLVRAVRAQLCPGSLELGNFGIYSSEDRKIFSDVS
jgi:hypothetical protein